MPEPMRTNGVRLASLFREVGLIDETEWEAHFKQNAEPGKRLVDILFQDVSWQTFVDLASLEIKLPTGGKKAGKALPVELTQAVHIQRREIIELLEKYEPDAGSLCTWLARSHRDLSNAINKLLEDLEDNEDLDPSRELVDRGILTPEIFSEFVQKGESPPARKNRQRLALEILVLNSMIEEEEYERLLAALPAEDFDLAAQLKTEDGDEQSWSRRLAEAATSGMALPTADVREVVLDDGCRDFAPVPLLRRELFLPIELNETVRLVISDPLNLSVPDLLAVLTGKQVVPFYSPPYDIMAAINRNFPPTDEEVRAEEEQRRQEEREARVAARQPAPETAQPGRDEGAELRRMPRIVDSMSAVQLVSSLVESAVATKSTDIHLEPTRDGMRVRYRIDGQLHRVMNIPNDMTLPVVSRIKVLANMNVTERRRPQDGHFNLDMGGRRIDFRVASLPANLGEKIVLRILDQATVLKALSELGLNETQEKLLSSLVQKPYGLLLVTGPTGSGKTTTLYSALDKVNREDMNITTIEDPVEYELPGINQVQIDLAIALTFAGGLRAALRQDPDVIMVGEIRDPETARIGIRAAMTGHLVLSTLHTNTAVGAMTALRHLEVQPYLIASALIGVVAQRLVKMICEECREPVEVTPGLKRDLRLPDDAGQTVYRGKGCSACLNTGYSGRIGVFEVLSANEELRRLIIEKAEESRLLKEAREQDFETLHEAALEKVLAGVTSPEEVMRAVYLMDT
jgi:type IV pilus assembly protein PilB